MRKTLILALTAGLAAVATAPADASGGCGPDGHREINNGRCIRNYPVADAGYRYVRGRGYYDGHRYWQNRYRDHGQWRYR